MGETDAVLRSSRALLGIVARSVATALDEVTLPQLRVLVVLEMRGPLGVTALAEHVGAVVSTFSRALNRLEDGGWVSRAPGAQSRREVTVSITDRGSRLVAEVTEARRRELDRVLSRMDASDRAALAATFATFADAAGEPPAADLLVLGL